MITDPVNRSGIPSEKTIKLYNTYNMKKKQ
jgi:hypothetical protein